MYRLPYCTEVQRSAPGCGTLFLWASSRFSVCPPIAQPHPCPPGVFSRRRECLKAFLSRRTSVVDLGEPCGGRGSVRRGATRCRNSSCSLPCRKRCCGLLLLSRNLFRGDRSQKCRSLSLLPVVREFLCARWKVLSEDDLRLQHNHCTVVYEK